MAQSTTNLGKIHVFPSETLYNQFKDIIADNDLALLKDDGAYIVAALLEQNGYVKFSNGLILQWGIITCTTGREGEFIFPISFTTKCLSFAASASIPANLCTITTAKFTAHDMNYGIPYKEDVFGLFIGI